MLSREALCAAPHTPHPKPAGAGAPARIAPAAQARSVRRRAADPQTFIRQFIWYGEYAGRRAPMLPKGDLSAAPHTPRPRYGAAAPRTCFKEVAAHRAVLDPKPGAGSEPRGAPTPLPRYRAAAPRTCFDGVGP